MWRSVECDATRFEIQLEALILTSFCRSEIAIYERFSVVLGDEHPLGLQAIGEH
jgi:hypothetical protein